MYAETKMWYVEFNMEALLCRMWCVDIPSSFSKSTGNCDDPELGNTNDNSAPTSVTCKVHDFAV